ncbi:MAG: hypothetical protein AAF224_00615 [Pseudomonadota bacterium]
MVLSPVVVSLMLFIASLVAVSGFYFIHTFVDRLLAEAPARKSASELTYTNLAE